MSMAGLSEIMKHCMYIGMADDVLALAQCKTRLYVLNVVNLRYLTF
jgi:DNA mismatch repair protein MLH1